LTLSKKSICEKTDLTRKFLAFWPKFLGQKNTVFSKIGPEGGVRIQNFFARADCLGACEMLSGYEVQTRRKKSIFTTFCPKPKVGFFSTFREANGNSE
jgi:hypothetical protein